uniref:Uncharacterized protein n=1 Tax=Oryza brachyantha TaxID=4533 RepID=J3M3M5_ORYBR
MRKKHITIDFAVFFFQNMLISLSALDSLIVLEGKITCFSYIYVLPFKTCHQFN